MGVRPTRLRVRAAIALAVLYVVCVIMPSVALAFAGRGVTIRCLSLVRYGIAQVSLQSESHTHSGIHTHGAVVRENADGVPIKGGNVQLKQHAGWHCGFFCFVAVVENLAATIGRHSHASPLFWAADEILHGCGPSRISRPPMTSLSN